MQIRWERRIAKKGQPRASAVDYLRSIGFGDFASCYNPMADSILGHLLTQTTSGLVIIPYQNPTSPCQPGEQVWDEGLMVRREVPFHTGTLGYNTLGS